MFDPESNGVVCYFLIIHIVLNFIRKLNSVIAYYVSKLKGYQISKLRNGSDIWHLPFVFRGPSICRNNIYTHHITAEITLNQLSFSIRHKIVKQPFATQLLQRALTALIRLKMISVGLGLWM